MLLALVTPAVFQARRSAQNAAIKAEIDMLHMAMMQYKNEYGSFPPCTVPILCRRPIEVMSVRSLVHEPHLLRLATPNITEVPATISHRLLQTSLYMTGLKGYYKKPNITAKFNVR